MQLQNTFYYVRFVNGILDDIIRIEPIHCGSVNWCWLQWMRWCCMLSIFDVSSHHNNFSLHTFLQFLPFHSYVMVDSCFRHRNHIHAWILASSDVWNDAFATRECSHFPWLSEHGKGNKWYFLFDTTNEGTSEDNSILGKIHIESWRHGILPLKKKKQATYEFLAVFVHIVEEMEMKNATFLLFFLLLGVVLNDFWCTFDTRDTHTLHPHTPFKLRCTKRNPLYHHEQRKR